MERIKGIYVDGSSDQKGKYKDTAIVVYTLKTEKSADQLPPWSSMSEVKKITGQIKI